jgi:tRNA nucleotidyltransferase/poly(A) polymerase
VKHLEKLNPAFQRQVEIVREAASELSIPVWLVGGPVRDLLLDRRIRDLDFLVETAAERLAAEVARRSGGRLRTYEAFLAAKVLLEGEPPIDIITARRERYPHPGALPEVEPAQIEVDLRRRDFTVNAIALPLDGESLVDPAGGMADLDRRLIRVLHDESFVDDPTRILRGLRLAARLGFSIEDHTMTLLDAALRERRLDSVSRERVWHEMVLAFEDEAAPAVLASFLDAGAIGWWIGAESETADQIRTLKSIGDLLQRITEADPRIVYLAVLLAAFSSTKLPAGTGFSRRQGAATLELAQQATTLADTWKALGSDEERARFCLEHSPEQIVVAAAAAPEAVRDCIPVRDHRLPFGGDALGVEPGPHIAAALRDTRIESWLGRIHPDELLSFARRRALRYLSEWS